MKAACLISRQAGIVSIICPLLHHVQEDHSAELEVLKQESDMPLEDLLKSLPAEMFDNDSSASQKVKLKITVNLVVCLHWILNI